MAEDRVERKLAAILAADVAGYSRLMGADEEGTLAALKAHRRELIDPKIAEHRGRIVKTTGDGALVEFASVVDAVRCAMEIQRGMTERNTDVPADKRIQFRVGINLGDIIIDGGDIFGDGVNIAARLENLAEPGGICVSQVVRDQVQDKLSFAFADMGAQTVKNIARPVHAYRITTGATARPPAPRARKIPVRFLAAACAVVVIALGVWLGKDEFLRASAPAQGLSIVVLPFSNLSGDTSQDYLADVITDELTTYLSRLPGSFVIARTTALTYKGRAIDAKQIGRDLGVSYLLEGGVQPSGNRVRIDAQLIDTKTGANLWVEKFDNERGNLLQMQDEIVFRLARALHSELNNVEVARLHRTQGNPDSETMAMQCEAALLRYGAASSEMEKNYSNCERALQIDPRNVRALSISAFQTGYRIITGRSSDVHGDTARVGELADRALQVDPNYYLAHHAKAYDHMLSARWHEVVVEEERALALNPVYIGAFMPMFIATLKLNQFDKTVELADKAIRFSPRDPILFVIYSYKGQALFLLRKFDPAIEWLDKSVAANTFYPNSQAILAAAFAMAGRNEEAHLQMVRYLARGDVHIKTIRQVESVPPLSFPLILEGLRKAGMPEQ